MVQQGMLMPLLVSAQTHKEAYFTPVIRVSEDPVDNFILIEKELTTIHKLLRVFARLFSQTEHSDGRKEN